jgi:hypothetical protein
MNPRRRLGQALDHDHQLLASGHGELDSDRLAWRAPIYVLGLDRRHELWISNAVGIGDITADQQDTGRGFGLHYVYLKNLYEFKNLAVVHHLKTG